MARSLLTVLDSLREKIDALNRGVETLRTRNRELEEENEVLRRTIEDTVRERDKARLDSDFLAVSHRLAYTHPEPNLGNIPYFPGSAAPLQCSGTQTMTHILPAPSPRTRPAPLG